MDERLIKDIRDRFAEYERDVPDHLLDDIEKEMERRCMFNDDRRNLYLIRLRRIAAIAVLILAAAGLIYYITTPAGERELMAISNQQAEIDENNHDIITLDNSIVEPVKELSVAEKQVVTETLVDQKTNEEKLDGNTDLLQEEDKHIEKDGDEKNEDSQKEEKTGFVRNKESSHVQHTNSRGVIENKPRRHSLITIGVNASGIPAQKQSRAGISILAKPNQYYISHSDFKGNANAVGDVFAESSDKSGYIGSTDVQHGSSNLPDYSLQDDYKRPSEQQVVNQETVRKENAAIEREGASKTHHHHPLKLGLSVRFNLSERWGLQTGLTYSHLASDITHAYGGNIVETEQDLHYVGVPLMVDYKVWGNRFVSLYASAGGEVQKMIKGKAVTENDFDGNNIGSKETRLKMKGLQLSAIGTLGAQYNLTKTISIYAEPGISYYFKNNSDIETIYKDKPFAFNLNLGLRFSVGD